MLERMRKNTQFKTWVVIFVVGIFIAGLMGFVVERFLNTRPEIELIKAFLLKNQAVQNEFGNPISVAYIQEGGSVSFDREIKGGNFRFLIKGSRKSGKICVYWQNKPSFAVQRIEMIMPAGRQWILLWTSENNSITNK